MQPKTLSNIFIERCATVTTIIEAIEPRDKILALCKARKAFDNFDAIIGFLVAVLRYAEA